MPRKPRIRKEVLWSAFIVLIMVSSAFGVMFYGFSTPSSKLKYGEYTFTVTQEGFATQIEGKRFLFGSFPGDVERINVSPSIIDRLRNTRMVYLTYDPNQSTVEYMATAQFEFQRQLNEIGIFAASALTVPTEYELPVVTCRNSTQFVPVLDFREGNETSIVLLGDCIVLNAARSEDYSRLKDRLMFGMLGIIE